jgi:predicted AAA+ superfamily ATPase
MEVEEPMSFLAQPVEADSSGPAGALGTLLGAHIEVPAKLKRAIAGYMLVSSAAAIAKRAHRQARDRFMYTIAVPSTDDSYDILHERMLALIPPARRRSIIVKTMRGHRASRSGELEAAPIGYVSPKLRPGVFYDSSRPQQVTIGGQRVTVAVENENDGHSEGDRYYAPQKRILFTAYGVQARDAVMDFITEITDDLNEPEAPRFYMPRWDSWNRRDDLVPRQLDTVILRAGQKERLLADLRKFLSGRAAYEQLGIPWHRGYLLHGPPGTGKTSLARAAATELGIDVYYLPISDVREDTNLLSLVSSVPARSMLLLEDIDVLHAAKSRDDGQPGVTMSGVLNALDGVSTPAGLIVVMTTNHREVLDEAIVRAGRVDCEEEIGYLDDEQLTELLERFFGGELDWFPPPIDGREIAPADIAEVLKRHMGDPDAQSRALCKALAP